MTPNASWDQCKALAEKHQFTAGPWKVTDTIRREGVCKVSASGPGLVAIVGNGFNIGTYVNDAHLIAAAPELLDIAERILERGYVSKHIEEERADYLALEAAIAKARGQS